MDALVVNTRRGKVVEELVKMKTILMQVFFPFDSGDESIGFFCVDMRAEGEEEGAEIRGRHTSGASWIEVVENLTSRKTDEEKMAKKKKKNSPTLAVFQVFSFRHSLRQDSISRSWWIIFSMMRAPFISFRSRNQS